MLSRRLRTIRNARRTWGVLPVLWERLTRPSQSQTNQVAAASLESDPPEHEGPAQASTRNQTHS